MRVRKKFPQRITALSFIFIGLVFISVSCTSKSEPPKLTEAPKVSVSKQSVSIQKLLLASQFFANALDESLNSPEALKSKYCDISFDQVSLYSMQVKARLDDWAKSDSGTDLPPAAECAKSCVCDAFILLGEQSVYSRKLPANFKEAAETAQALKKKENPAQCLLELGDFCRSGLFQDLKKSVQENMN